MPYDYTQLDPAIEMRVETLLAQMTLAEKVGQLSQVAPYAPLDSDEFARLVQEAQAAGTPMPSFFQMKPGLEDAIRAGMIGSILNLADPHLVNHYQRVAVEQTRLGIPLLIGSDVIHGFRTVFPIPLAESATWNPGLLEQAARVSAEEGSAAGIDWFFAPMVDIARDARWGRIAEGGGEDVFLVAELARARVRGFQAEGLESGRRVAACPKHYVAYGAAEGGRDYNTTDLSERTLRDVYLPPFRAAFEAGAGTVMSSFNEIGGVPVSANSFVLRDILREEWQWPGVVLSDYEAVRELIPHGVAADLQDAARLSLLAGVDMDMVSEAYVRHVPDLVAAGSVPQELVDAAVRRVLRLKFQLGLFDQPYVDATLLERIILREEACDLALEVARQAMVLLKNEGGLLPLMPGAQRLAVIGPLADARADMLGTWVLFGKPDDVETILAGVCAVAGADVLHTPAGSVKATTPDEIVAAVAAAQQADVVLLVLGESADMSGEARSRAHLGLPGNQQELFDAVVAVGKPVIVVLACGRPLVIPRVAEQAQALLVAWHGGIRAGRAVADLLFGIANPSGKLTAGWPRSEGQIPVHYAHKNTGRPMESSGVVQFGEPFKSRYIDVPNEPLFPFGFGLSYTSFVYRDLLVETPQIGRDGTLAVSAVVANTGTRTGSEVVQLYVRDLLGSVTRPVKELKGFQRITLEPGETQTVRFTLHAQELGFHGLDMQYRVEPGTFAVWIGPDSVRGLDGTFTVGENLPAT